MITHHSTHFLLIYSSLSLFNFHYIFRTLATKIVLFRHAIKSLEQHPAGY